MTGDSTILMRYTLKSAGTRGGVAICSHASRVRYTLKSAGTNGPGNSPRGFFILFRRGDFISDAHSGTHAVPARRFRLM